MNGPFSFVGLEDKTAITNINMKALIHGISKQNIDFIDKWERECLGHSQAVSHPFTGHSHC